jgi:hypothetical protein
MIDRKFPIAGVKFRGAEVYVLLKTLENGTVFELEPEPTNAFDPNAVKINYNDGEKDIHIGYVPKNFSAEISAALEIEPVICIASDFSKDKKSWEFEVRAKSIDETIDVDEEFTDGDDEDDDPGELKENEDFAHDNDLEREDENA